MRHHTGLRNKYRTGRSIYSLNRKRNNADRYGTYTNGVMRTGEIIAGTTISKPLPSMDQ